MRALSSNPRNVGRRKQSENYSYDFALCLGAIVALSIQIGFDLETRVGAFQSLPLYTIVFFSTLFVCQLIGRHSRLAFPARAIFHILFVIHFSACFLFDAFYEDAVHRRYSLLDADGDNLAYLLHSILPAGLILALAGTIGAIYLAEFFFHNRIRGKSMITVALLFVCAIGAWRSERPTLHAFIASDINDYLNGSPLSRANRSASYPISDYLVPQAILLPGDLHSRRILLFVMESITIKALELECARKPCVFQKF